MFTEYEKLRIVLNSSRSLGVKQRYHRMWAARQLREKNYGDLALYGCMRLINEQEKP
jgi:hypothetical protein